MNGPLEWFAAIGTIVAAALIASDRGRKVTGWAFVLFVIVSVAWIVAGMLSGNSPIAIQNGAMLFVNGWGVYQYLLSRKKKREMEIVEPYAEKVHEQVEREAS